MKKINRFKEDLQNTGFRIYTKTHWSPSFLHNLYWIFKYFWVLFFAKANKYPFILTKFTAPQNVGLCYWIFCVTFWQSLCWQCRTKISFKMSPVISPFDIYQVQLSYKDGMSKSEASDPRLHNNIPLWHTLLLSRQLSSCIFHIKSWISLLHIEASFSCHLSLSECTNVKEMQIGDRRRFQLHFQKSTSSRSF